MQIYKEFGIKKPEGPFEFDGKRYVADRLGVPTMGDVYMFDVQLNRSHTIRKSIPDNLRWIMREVEEDKPRFEERELVWERSGPHDAFEGSFVKLGVEGCVGFMFRDTDIVHSDPVRIVCGKSPPFFCELNGGGVKIEYATHWVRDSQFGGGDTNAG